MTFSEKSNRIFWNATLAYHNIDDVDAEIQNLLKKKQSIIICI